MVSPLVNLGVSVAVMGYSQSIREWYDSREVQYLAAERARVGGVLRDFHLLDLLTQRGTVTFPVLAHHTGLLRALAHVYSV